jgi:hypothetical protein
MKSFVTRSTQHASAFGLAAVVTLAILAGIDSQAMTPLQQAQFAQQQADELHAREILSCPADHG